MVDVIDENGDFVNTVRRKEAYERRLKIKAAFVVVKNSRNEIHISQRSKNKEIFPLRWQVGAGGAVKSGESFGDAAKRELREEMGVVTDSLKFLFEYDYTDEKNNYRGRVYLVEWDGDVDIDKEEMSTGKWVSKQEITEKIGEGFFCPDTEKCINRYIEMGII